VPVHWDIKKGCRFFKQIREPSLETDEQLSATQKYGVIPQSLFMVREDQKVMLALGGLDNFKHVECDDFVISLRSFEGGIERSKYIGCVSPAYTVLRANSEFCADFWAFLLKSSSYISALQTMTDGIRDGKNISYAQFGALGIPVPHVHEQIVIARFLDRETAKIDALIAEQEKLIALLSEKRQATISRAVTRGLAPNMPLKDSGVPWLGKVPAHWEVTRLKHVTDLIVDCPHETPVYDDSGEYLVIRTADISEGRLDTSAMYSVDKTEYLSRIRRQALMKDDIVYGREGERWGYAALVPEDDVFCLGQRMMQFRPDKAMCSRYLMWQLNSRSTYRQGQIDTVGATSPHVNVGTIRNYVLVKPPRKEQVDISSFLDEETSRLDALDTEANRTISLLKERRAALISAAVTGKIDVRQLQG
jgi:type I restriction enzyme S subunit